MEDVMENNLNEYLSNDYIDTFKILTRVLLQYLGMQTKIRVMVSC